MRYIFSILLCLIIQTGFSQIIKTVGISYTNGTPTYTPAKAGSALALDTVTWRYYTWNGSTWLSDGFRVQTISGCAAPAYTPTKFQSLLVINACTAGQGGPELYYWTGLVWLQINEGQTYTAGTGIAISGSNEISNTAPDQTVLLNEGAGIDVTGTYPNFTLASTITQGLTSLNSQTGSTQTLVTGTTGTDFSISSTTNTHTFNLPSASAANRGALTSADWSVFNSKIAGSGTSGYLPKFSGASTLSNSLLYDNGTNIGIGTTSPSNAIDLFGSTTYTTIGITNTGAGGAAAFSLNSTANQPANRNWGFATNNSAWGDFSFKQSNVLFGNPLTAGAVRMYFDPSGNVGVGYSAGIAAKLAVSGNVGVGTATPGANLDVVGTIRSSTSGGGTNAIEFYRTATSIGTKWIQYLLGNDLSFYDTANRLYLQSGGNIGVGTASPTSNLHINASNGYAQLRLHTTYTPTSTADALGNTGDTAWDANYFYIKTAAGWKRAALSTF